MPVIAAARGGSGADESAGRCANSAARNRAADGAAGCRADSRAGDATDGRTRQGTILLNGLTAGEGNRGGADD
jgi:hypothetical protein